MHKVTKCKDAIAAIISVHIVIPCAIATNNYITIVAMFEMVVIMTITMVVIDTMSTMSTLLTTIVVTRIARAISIAIIRIARTIDTSTMERLIVIIHWSMVPKKTIMSCISMLAVE